MIQKVLIISDLHQDNTNIDLLISQLKQVNFDKIIIGGDFCNFSVENSKSKEFEQEYKKLLNNMMNQIQKGFNMDMKDIYYVPGNHDHISDFIKENQQNSNIHNKIKPFSQSLNIIGYGGSVSGFVENTDIKNFQGAPYNDNKFKENFKELEELDFMSQIILLTHNGPIHESSNYISEDGQTILTGTNTFDKFKELNKNNIICHIHGHNHAGVGIYYHKEIPLINPGSLRDNKSLSFQN